MNPQTPSIPDDLLDALVQRLKIHETYGQAMADHAAKKSPTVLNYHTHGPAHGYCVSIAAKESSPIPVLGQSPRLKELAHIRGIGQHEDQCVPLMSALGKKLKDVYGLSLTPEIYLNGHPMKTE